MLRKVFGNNRPVDQSAINTGPYPFSSFSYHKLSQIRIPTGIQGAEAVSAILTLEVVARVIVTVASGGVLDRLICHTSNEAWVVSDHAVGP